MQVDRLLKLSRLLGPQDAHMEQVGHRVRINHHIKGRIEYEQWYMFVLTVVLIILFSLLSGGIAGFLSYKRGIEAGIESENERQAQLRQGAMDEASRILADAETKAKQQALAIKEDEMRRRNEMDAEQDKRRKELERIEERLQNRLDTAERRLEQMENRERKLNQRASKLDQMEEGLTKLEEERVSNCSVSLR